MPKTYLQNRGEYWHKQKMKSLVRDNFTCQIHKLKSDLTCDENRLRFLHTHHIKSRIQGGTHDLDNLLTICRAHHEDIHPHMKKELAAGPTQSFELQMREI